MAQSGRTVYIYQIAQANFPSLLHFVQCICTNYKVFLYRIQTSDLWSWWQQRLYQLSTITPFKTLFVLKNPWRRFSAFSSSSCQPKDAKLLSQNFSTPLEWRPEKELLQVRQRAVRRNQVGRDSDYSILFAFVVNG